MKHLSQRCNIYSLSDLGTLFLNPHPLGQPSLFGVTIAHSSRLPFSQLQAQLKESPSFLVISVKSLIYP